MYSPPQSGGAKVAIINGADCRITNVFRFRYRHVFESKTSEGDLLRYATGDQIFVVVGFLQAGFLSLIFLPAALGGHFCTSFFDDFFSAVRRGPAAGSRSRCPNNSARCHTN